MNIRLLYSSNAMWASSGYGVQSRSLLPRLAELDTVNGRENIAQFAWYGLHGGVHNVDGFTIFPGGADQYGNDIIGHHTKAFRANVVVTLIDAWVLQEIKRKVAPALWLPWLPVDHEPVPEKVFDAVKDAHLPLTYSKFGYQELKNKGLDNMYIPHGIEPEIYKIYMDNEVLAFKQRFLRHEGFLVAMVAANKGYPDRKAFQVQLRAFANFAKNKQDVKLYIHTEPTPMYGGLNLNSLIQQLGITDKVLLPDRYELMMGYPAQFLALLYNASNVYLANSMAEGFGIPIIEAQACGTPVITTNFTSMPELIRYGDIVEPLDVFWTPLDSWQCWPDHKAITNSLEEHYQAYIERGYMKDYDLGEVASKKIHEEFSWDTIVKDYWKPLFEQLHSTIFKVEQSKPHKEIIGKVLPC